MPYHSHVDPNVVVAAINRMIDQVNDGDPVFYDFYTEQQKRDSPAKSSTGLFFFKGQPGAPFAIVCPGGGFRGKISQSAPTNTGSDFFVSFLKAPVSLVVY